jgi:hypothetical protein
MLYCKVKFYALARLKTIITQSRKKIRSEMKDRKDKRNSRKNSVGSKCRLLTNKCGKMSIKNILKIRWLYHNAMKGCFLLAK